VRWLARRVKVRNAIIDDEICCLGKDGWSMFNSLLLRRRTSYFYAFDVLWLNGRDLRKVPLLRRKQKLQGILPGIAGSPILFTSHLHGKGITLYNAACEHDLEGIVAERKNAPYESDERAGSWVKIENPLYRQIRGRRELFARV
jgi:bifunctional non-homologous end joining protein LigD